MSIDSQPQSKSPDSGKVNAVRFILSADTCIRIMESRPLALLQKIADCQPGEIGVSAITVAELRHWAAKSPTIVKTNEDLRAFLSMLHVINYDETAATVYGTIQFGAEQSRSKLPPLEILVASHALAANAVYITTRPEDFEFYKRLMVDDWSC